LYEFVKVFESFEKFLKVFEKFLKSFAPKVVRDLKSGRGTFSGRFAAEMRLARL